MDLRSSLTHSCYPYSIYFPRSASWSVAFLQSRTMSIPQRTLQSHGPHGYQEVSLAFRKARNSALEQAGIGQRENRLVCPVVDAARTPKAYGKCFLNSLDKKGLEDFAKSLHGSADKVKFLAYLAAPTHEVLPNMLWNKTFYDTKLKGGALHKLKCGVHTGILNGGIFHQETFNEFVWNVFPELKGTPIDNEFVCNEQKSNGFFLTEDHIDKIMEWNINQSDEWFKFFGPYISREGEMRGLLMNKVGQEIPKEDGTKMGCISLRDMHDLYKYGVVSAHYEDRLLELGLIDKDCLALTARQ